MSTLKRSNVRPRQLRTLIVKPKFREELFDFLNEYEVSGNERYLCRIHHFYYPIRGRRLRLVNCTFSVLISKPSISPAFLELSQLFGSFNRVSLPPARV